MDFIDQIGSRAYLSVNVGSGTPQEAAEWLEYLTAAQPTALREGARRQRPSRALQGRLSSGIGNESWDCGGNMTPEYYLQPAEDLQPLRRATSTRRSARAASAC